MDGNETERAGPRRIRLQWIAAGLLLLGLHVGLWLLSPRFGHGIPLEEKPVLALVGLELAAGFVYLLMLLSLRKAPSGKGLLLWIVAAGLLMRGALFFSTPMLEDDFYRYFWDGGVLAFGVSPYAHAPADVMQDGAEASKALRALALESSEVHGRINHPHLRTIYPPLAQGAFFLAHAIRPWSLTAWRGVLLLFDLGTLIILLALLRKLRLSPLWIAAYWWCPLLIKETYNSGHMDVLALPFVLAAVFFCIGRRHLLGAVLLSLAAGLKIWPAVLLPLVLRPLLKKPGRLLVAAAVFLLIAAALFLPILRAGLDEGSGFTAYGKRWEMNDALFMLLVRASGAFLKLVGIHPGHGQLAARILALLLIAAWIGRLSRRAIGDGADLCERCLLAVAALFLLSPTQFPWYYIWVLPFLALRPRPSLLLLAVLLPLYYLRSYFQARGQVEFFDNGVVWLEYVPVWILLIREGWLSQKAVGGEAATGRLRGHGLSARRSSPRPRAGRGI